MPTAADLDRQLADAGIPVDAADLLAALAQVGATRLVEPDAPGPKLTATEAGVLARHAGIEPDRSAPRRVRARTAAKTALLYAEALTTADVAALLQLSTSRVRHLVRDHRLYVLPVDRRSGLRFPAWQFDGGGLVPGMNTVLAAMPRGMHPLEVGGFFTTATPDLPLDGDTPSTPLRWLRSGGDPTIVADLASTIGAAA